MSEHSGAMNRAMEFLSSAGVSELLAKTPTIKKGVLIGLIGYAQVGKDTVASILAEAGFGRIAFADALRDMLYALNPLTTMGRIQSLVDTYGWEHAKVAFPGVRELLQRLGTEAGRQVLGEDVWVNAAMRKVQPRFNYVFTDVRFPNEADAIKAAGGFLVRVTRPGTGPVNGHASETALDGREVDWTIANDSTEDDLRTLVRHWVEKNGWE